MPTMKPVLHPLQTPKTMTFPSELHSNDSSSSLSDNVKHEDALSTPITPPAAYTEFLKALTPVFASPNSAGVNFSKFNFDSLSSGSNTNKPPAYTYSPTSQPASAVSTSFNFGRGPAVSGSYSRDSTRDSTSNGSTGTRESTRENIRESTRESMRRDPLDPPRSATASLPPPTPFAAPGPRRRDPRSLRALRIPPPPSVRYPAYSPTTMLSSPRSATTLRSPYSPSDWALRYLEGPQSASGRLSVKHVVTHTVTYKRTELEDPPKGKRRKVQHEERRERERERERERDRDRDREHDRERERERERHRERDA